MFKKRFLAFYWDFLVVNSIFLILLMIFQDIIEIPEEYNYDNTKMFLSKDFFYSKGFFTMLATNFVLYLIWFLYDLIFTYKSCATPGKMRKGIVVIPYNTDNNNFYNYFIRSLTKIIFIPGFLVLFQVIIYLFFGKGRFLHDIFGKTTVSESDCEYEKLALIDDKRLVLEESIKNGTVGTYKELQEKQREVKNIKEQNRGKNNKLNFVLIIALLINLSMISYRIWEFKTKSQTNQTNSHSQSNPIKR